VCERDERRGESDMRRWRKEPDIRLCRCRNRGTNSKQAVEKFIRICDCVTSKRGSANNACVGRRCNRRGRLATASRAAEDDIVPSRAKDTLGRRGVDSGVLNAAIASSCAMR
jgi:hypothetical protein